MSTRSRASRPLAGLLLILAVALLFGALPPRPAEAGSTTRAVDNTVAEFTLGQFQRAGLTAASKAVAGGRPADRPGAVQLGPLGLLKNWTGSSLAQLPKPLRQHASTVVGTRIYVLGGVSPGSGNAPEYQAKVYSAAVDLTTGGIPSNPGWQEEPELNLAPIQDRPQGLTPLQPNKYVASSAVASVFTPGVGGFIYLIGGETPQSGPSSINILSTHAVRYARVDGNGRIVTTTGWQTLTGAQLPPDPAATLGFGLTGVRAVTITTAGRTFIYLFGGLKVFPQGASIVSQGSARVLRAEVRSDGKLVKPGTSQEGWEDINKSIPKGTTDSEGFWDGVAVGDFFPAAGPAGSRAIYLIGGYDKVNVGPPVSFRRSPYVFRLPINADGSAGNWFPDSTPFLLPKPRVGHAGVLFRGNFYISGGLEDTFNAPSEKVLTSYVQDDLTLPDLDDDPLSPPSSNFLENTALSSFPRSSHASVVVPAGSSSPNSAFVYVIGGQGGQSGEQFGTSTVIFAKIGGGEDIQSGGYALSGWYYSRPFQITFRQAEVQQVRWTTAITRTLSNLDIGIDYRVSGTDCGTPSWGSWSELDGVDGNPLQGFRSLDGVNAQDVAAITGVRCFQYRARLSTGDRTVTPLLLNLGIRIYTPGNPDIFQVENPATGGRVDRRNGQGKLVGFDVTLKNQDTAASPNGDPPTTLDADFDEPGGGFFVDLFIYGPAATAPNPAAPTIPTNESDSNNKAYALINKTEMGADALKSVVDWCVQNGAQTCTKFDPLAYFEEAGPGWYTVFVVVDATDDHLTNPANPQGAYVDETDDGELSGEQNNVRKFSFRLLPGDVQRVVYMPVTRR